jgi:predicted site-specific integrase-resolvase
MSQLVSISAAAKELGVHPSTLRRWEEEGRIDPPERTTGGDRRYDLAKLRRLVPHLASSSRATVAYARVLANEQEDHFTRQVALLESFCTAQGWTYEVISDVGSGLNYHKRGLKQLIHRICSGEVGRLVLSHKDRLLRFGSELVFALCEQFGVEVIIINASEDSSFEEDLASDVIEIITVFSARLYGARNHQNKQIMDQLREVARNINA